MSTDDGVDNRRQLSLLLRIMPGSASRRPRRLAHPGIYRHNLDVGIMGCFMTQGCIVACPILERLEGWHLYVVHDRRIIGLVAAMPDKGTGVAKEPVSVFEALDGIDLRDRAVVIMLGQTVDLFDIEYIVGLQERYLPIDLAASSIVLGLREAAGKNDGGTGLALAHGSIQLQGLFERHPGL